MVIGAGVGGLACAIELAAAGLQVTVLERQAGPGGKMRDVRVGGAAIDAGPTVFTMRWVFDALFERAGGRLEDHLTLKPLSVLARHAWSGGDRLDLFADIRKSADAIGAFAGAAEARGYQAFCAEGARIFETLKDTYLTAEQTGPFGLALRAGPARAGGLFGLRPFETLWSALGDHFKDPRLRQLFGRYATYCGASPFAAPATLMLIAHVEQAGVWSVEGGMRRLADALASAAEKAGAVIRYGAEVEQIDVAGGRAAGVRLLGGERIGAAHVVVNADAAALASGLFGLDTARAVASRPPSDRSLSAITWAVKAQTSGFPLLRHNVFFSDDYRAEFDDIFAHNRPPAQPTVYVCAQDRADDAVAAGAERLLILMNAPARGDSEALNLEERAACQTNAFSRLARCGLSIEPEGAVMTTPTDFHALFPGTGGALYGPATHGWAAAFRRPGANTRLPGLYLAGGGAHPGAGVPMAALSGRLAAMRLMKDRASTSPFRRRAIAGGISTPSATTAASA